MKCAQCGHQMERFEGTHRYHESGLKDVLLMGIPMYRCPSCKETEIEIPHIAELHLLLAFLIVLQPRSLRADEVRFLRKHLGYSQEELASKLGVSRLTITRWENGRTIRHDQDKHLRRFYLDKRGEELEQLSAIKRILSTLIDSLPENKRIRRIHREDWTSWQPHVPA